MRSILSKIVFFNPFVSCSRGLWQRGAAGVLPQPQLNAISNVHATMPTKRRAADVRPLEPKGKIKKGPSKSTEVSSMPPPVPTPEVVSMVDSISPSSQEVSETLVPGSSSHRQGAEARRVKRTRSGKRKIQNSEAGCDRVETQAHLGSPSYHQSGMSSDDLYGEDEVESVRPGHVEALGAADMSLESEGGVTGAAAFGTKRGRMPSAIIAIVQLYGWSSSGGFAEATCLEAEPGRCQLKITEDLVGGPHGGIVHFCATDAKVCKAGWPGRRVYHFDIWRPFTITGNGSAAQKGVKNHEVVSVVPPAAQANIPDEDVDSLGPGPQPVSGKPTELQQKLEDIKSRLGGLGALPRVPGRRRVPLQSDEPLSRRQHRGLADLLPRIHSMIDGSSQSAGQVTSSDLLRGIVESQSDHKIKCEDDLRRHDGAGSDDFFESELVHEASPRAGSNLLERSRLLPGRLLAEALKSMRSFLGPREEADVSHQPRVLAYLETVFNQRYGKDAVGLRTSREMRTIAESIDALVEGDVLRAGDLLIQRFKALETSVTDGTWSRARQHELIPEEGVGLASAAERQAISRLELQRRKLTEMVSKK